MKLYTYFRSSAAFRVRIALNLKRLAYEAKFVHLAKGEHRKSEYASVNRQALVPTLELDDGTRLTQSLAIIEYLDEKHPQPALVPKDALGRARVRSLAQSEEQIKAWYKHWIEEGLAKLEAELAGSAATETHCHGNSPTMIDCCLVPQIFNAKRYDCDLAPYPVTMRVFDACMKLDAFDRAQPSKQPDAE